MLVVCLPCRLQLAQKQSSTFAPVEGCLLPRGRPRRSAEKSLPHAMPSTQSDLSGGGQLGEGGKLTFLPCSRCNKLNICLQGQRGDTLSFSARPASHRQGENTRAKQSPLREQRTSPRAAPPAFTTPDIHDTTAQHTSADYMDNFPRRGPWAGPWFYHGAGVDAWMALANLPVSVFDELERLFVILPAAIGFEALLALEDAIRVAGMLYRKARIHPGRYLDCLIWRVEARHLALMEDIRRRMGPSRKNISYAIPGMTLMGWWNPTLVR